MTATFVIKEIDSKNVGDYTRKLTDELGEKYKTERKLTSCLSAEKSMLLAPLLKRYLNHGLAAPKVYGLVEATSH